MNTDTHELLSESLAGRDLSKGQTLNGLLRRTDGRSLYLVMILLCLPFVSPIPVPGLSNVFGIVISIFAFRLARDLPPKLPSAFGDKEFPRKWFQTIVSGTVKLMRALEKIAKPRHSHVFGLRMIKGATIVALFLLGLLLALPIPPVVPFSNSLPSWGIILIALATMERDGVMIWVGYAMATAACLYLALITGAVLASAERVYDFLQASFRI